VSPLLRRQILWLTGQRWFRSLVTDLPLGRAVAGRFVAGRDLDAAIAAARSLRRGGISSMLDHLGENVRSQSQASEATDAYIRALKRIREQPDLDCNISVKLTQLGLDHSLELCLENSERVLQAAASAEDSILVMIDMEASAYVDRTLTAYLALRKTYPNVGVCLQANLHRTTLDCERVGGPDAIIRMVKGAYLEPDEIAHRRRADVDRVFARATATLLGSGSTVHIATHDPRLIEGARTFIRARSISAERYEFQLLYGVRRDLQGSLVREGEPVRVYVPYGTEWYPYLTRRLAERPANIWFFLSNLIDSEKLTRNRGRAHG
jgi:proline dehydrogenase